MSTTYTVYIYISYMCVHVYTITSVFTLDFKSKFKLDASLTSVVGATDLKQGHSMESPIDVWV